MSGLQFPDGFLWGAATSAYQIEGATAADGRGRCIWDDFMQQPERRKAGATADAACDHYHRFEEDVRHMADLGLRAYRFSIAWPRIYPEANRRVNQRGIDFYRRLVDGLLASGIEPVPTLYHWDLPCWIQKKGGWVNRDTVALFEEYAQTVFESLASGVKTWITLNEPWVVSFVGYLFGTDAPGVKDLSAALRTAHHQLLAHGIAARNYRRQSSGKIRVGIALCLAPAYSAVPSDRARENAEFMDGFVNRWFLDPILRGAYPKDLEDFYRQAADMPEASQGDMELISSPVDFIGINYYVRQLVDESNKLEILNSARSAPSYEMKDVLTLEAHPAGLYDIMRSIHAIDPNVELLVTENGSPLNEGGRNDRGEIQDRERIGYLESHLTQVHRAVADGLPVRGYFLWTLLDDFEWVHGYDVKFGVIEVARPGLERKWKRSAYWYRDLIRANGFEQTKGDLV